MQFNTDNFSFSLNKLNKKLKVDIAASNPESNWENHTVNLSSGHSITLKSLINAVEDASQRELTTDARKDLKKFVKIISLAIRISTDSKDEASQLALTLGRLAEKNLLEKQHDGATIPLEAKTSTEQTSALKKKPLLNENLAAQPPSSPNSLLNKNNIKSTLISLNQIQSGTYIVSECLERLRGATLGKLFNDELLLDSHFLLSQVFQIEDKSDKQEALREFFKFQLKMLGIEMGIDGQIETHGEKINLSNGSVPFFTFSKMHLSLQRYMKNESNPEILEALHDAASIMKEARDLNIVWSYQENTLKEAGKILSPSAKERLQTECLELVNKMGFMEKMASGRPIVIPTGWVGHPSHALAVNLYKDPDGTLRLSLSDKGGDEDTLEYLQPGILIYQVPDPSLINENFFTKLLMLNFYDEEEGKAYLALGRMIDELGLEEEFYCPKQMQKASNCLWIAAKNSFQAQLLMQELYAQKSLSEFIRKNALDISIRIAKIINNNKQDPIDLDKIKREIKKYLLAIAPTQEKHLNKFLCLIDLSLLRVSDSPVELDMQIKKRLRSIPSSVVKDNVNLIYKEWAVTHREAEFEFFIGLLKQTASEHLLSDSEEFKILSEMFYKFLSVNQGLSKEERYAEISNTAGSAGKNIFELTKRALENKNYKLIDCIISLESIDTLESAQTFVRYLLRNQNIGSFMAYKCQGQDFLAYKTVHESQEDVEFESLDDLLGLDINEIREHIQENSGALAAFPVLNQFLIDQYVAQYVKK